MKETLHASWRRELKKLARELGVPADVRSNRGGSAIMGEVVLHSDRLYMTVSLDRNDVMYRTCQGRKDYVGGYNRWTSIAALRGRDEHLMETLRKLAA